MGWPPHFWPSKPFRTRSPNSHRARHGSVLCGARSSAAICLWSTGPASQPSPTSFNGFQRAWRAHRFREVRWVFRPLHVLIGAGPGPSPSPLHSTLATLDPHRLRPPKPPLSCEILRAQRRKEECRRRRPLNVVVGPSAHDWGAARGPGIVFEALEGVAGHRNRANSSSLLHHRLGSAAHCGQLRSVLVSGE
jgi:hypothetical protein